ncbi:hypothetical protein ACFE04_020930 [Oxalis oulophora]
MLDNNDSSEASKALSSLISKGWREVRDSADADLRLMRDIANTFKNNLTSSIDRELENFINSASTSFYNNNNNYNSSPTEIDFVKKLQPKISEFRRVYSAPDFRKRVLEKWGRGTVGANIRIDLSAIRKAIVSSELLDGTRTRTTQSSTVLNFREFWGEWKPATTAAPEDDQLWQPLRTLKTMLKEFEKKSEDSTLDFIHKFKSSIEVPPLDVTELFAYLLRQSDPFLDQLGVIKDICDKLIDSLCSKCKKQLLLHSLSAPSLVDNDNTNDELYLRITNVLQSTGHSYDGGFWTNFDPPNGKRHVAIVTTASLPWMTGTTVNPLFRVAHLAKSTQQDVTLLVSWLCKSDQEQPLWITGSFLTIIYFLRVSQFSRQRSFPNCLTYKTPEDFVSKVKEALANEPQPLTLEQQYHLSWEAATERFMEYSELDRVLKSSVKANNKGIRKSISMPSLSRVVDGGLTFTHWFFTGSELLRLCTGAIPGTRDYDKQQCKDLGLLPPQVENPIYGW